MKRFQPPKPISMTLNLAPLVDVMMCLIVFFLLASRLVSAQHSPLHLAAANAATQMERSELGPRVVINVRPAADGTSADYLIHRWDGRSIREERLKATELRAYLADRAGRAKKNDQPLRCVIRADRETEYAHVEMVLRACGLAKIANVAFSVNASDAEGDAP